MANNNAPGHFSRNGVSSNINAVGIDGATIGGASAGVAVSNLSDVCNFLQTPNINTALNLPAGACSYDHLIEMIRGLDLQDDGIRMNHKMKAIRSDFCALVHDENMLCECMDYINGKALGDGEMALKFAMLFSSHNFDQLAMKDIKIRSAMLKVLETNYLNADTYRVHDKERLYNSITLLGEYYNRVRLADQSPITILGESLLSLLIREVSALEPIDVRLAKLILSQITLNGDIIRVKHKNELTQLLYHIRRNLIEQPTLSATVKALLLMTLDLYYSNFTNLGAQLEQMYTKYLVQDVEDDGNNNINAGASPQAALPVYMPVMAQQSPQQLQLLQQQQHQPITPLQLQTQQSLTTLNNYSPQDQNCSAPNEAQASGVYENGGSENTANDSYESQPSTKKWSEQVCEDSLYESEFGNDFNSYEQDLKDGKDGADGGAENEVQGRLSNGRGKLSASGNSRYNDDDSLSRNARRSQKPRNSPRPLKHQAHDGYEGEGAHDEQQKQQREEQDQTKPLPRWRAPRFNRENEFQSGDKPQHNQQRRYSASFDDDHSVRSDGGSIRLYSINDRLRHSQEKMERSGSNFNSIANSNWDRQSQHADDRSERSYISNYERGNNYRRGNHHFNNRHNYDKPPRFQKPQQKDNNIHSNSWRQSRNNVMNNSYHDENSSYRSNGPESNSRSSSRARTLPRPSKSRHFDDADADDGANNASSYRRSQSPSMHRQNQQHQQRTRNFNARYSSQSSLASEASSTFDRRQRNRNFGRHAQQQQDRWEDTHSVHDQPDSNARNAKNDNSELVRNARQTVKYMNYLSSKK
ncbi:GATA zinc finger domain-containing protein 14-like [Anastrepha ludens]|uniref:GATA zinc finger domain-containing protein 14-like n=1 Tax=Anastrepha ludens TaxID=28586 RepID=UPI0023B0A63D|nr:GATA zinc finger domain-containing protein 14-like [Anastrepha ludens]